jgi:hypothetical protein
MKALIGQFKKLCELDNWKGTVLNVAHGMIPACMEFMHVLLQRPVRAQLMQLHAGYCSKIRSDRIHALARLILGHNYRNNLTSECVHFISYIGALKFTLSCFRRKESAHATP